MEVFKTDDGTAYVAAEIKLTKDEAITYANQYFHTKKAALDADKAIVRGDSLVWSKKCIRKGDRLVWVVFRK